MSDHVPRVSIGMPVFNGEPYLRKAIESILAQTYEDFELIISDNASTDATEEICREYAARDSRISYYRSDRNLGGAWNQNRVVHLSRGEYFTWAHHDDIRAPEHIEKTLQILDSDSSLVFCHSLTSVIDKEGNLQDIKDKMPDMMSDMPSERFRLACMVDHANEANFSLIRSSILKRTRLMGAYTPSDKILTAELCLYGKFYRVPEGLFFRRQHPLQSLAKFPSMQSRIEWWDPRKKGKIVFPHFKEFSEYLQTVTRVPLPMGERVRCVLAIAKWPLVYRKRMFEDVSVALREFLRPPEVLRPIWRPVLTWFQNLLSSSKPRD